MGKIKGQLVHLLVLKLFQVIMNTDSKAIKVACMTLFKFSEAIVIALGKKQYKCVVFHWILLHCLKSVDVNSLKKSFL